MNRILNTHVGSLPRLPDLLDRMHRFLCRLALPVLLLAMPAAAVAQKDYPSRPIRVVMPFPAGEGADIILRTAAEKLLPRLRQPLIIENRPGGNMLISAQECMRSAPDGYTVCVINSTTMSVNPHVMAKLPYDPDKDFKAITNMYFIVGGVMIGGGVPGSSVDEFRALSMAKPGTVNFGTFGPNTNIDMFRQWLNRKWNTELVGVPYKGGAPILAALASGELDATWVGVLNALGQIKAGKVKLLAVDSRKRFALFPDVPTFGEVGLGDMPLLAWHGLAVPAGTSDAIVQRLNAEFVQLFREPGFAEFLIGRAVEVATGSPEEFAQFMKKDRERTGEVIRRFNLPR